ncbi:hypothetical protein PAMP_019693 [Pampus punctatissimus]
MRRRTDEEKRMEQELGGAIFQSESHISSSATPMLTKHQLVIAVLEWPIEAAGQGAAGLPRRAMPRELEKAEEPQPPVPIRLCADNCTGP